MTPLRRAAATLLVTALAGAGVAMAAVPAEAASSYRYWSYWFAGPSASSWTYGPIGPAGHTVVDGAVEGWRFVVAAPNPSGPRPRHAASTAFKDICGSKPRPAGQVRVALVVDFGTGADAPPHESPPGGVTVACVVVPEGSRGLKVLAAYAPRIEGGLVCGLSGYPAHECGVVVKTPSPTPTPSPSKPKPTASAAAPPPTRTPSSSPSHSPSASKGAGGSGQATPAATPSSSTLASPSPSAPAGSGEPVPDANASEDPAVAVGPPPPAGGSGSGTPAGLLLGGAVVVGLGAAAVLRTRSQHRGTA